MERLAVSVKERRRLEVLHRVATGELTLVKASESLSLSYRQTKRVYVRCRSEEGLRCVHRLRGRRSGPTLAAEYLAGEDGVEVAVKTLRQWLKGAGL